MKHVYLIFSLSLLVVACAKSPDATSDNWETPTLIYRKASDNSSEAVALNRQSRLDVHTDDQFEFRFRSENKIANLKVQARCGQQSNLEDAYFEEFDVGGGLIYKAYNLLPPTAIFDQTKNIYCALSLIISNEVGSTRRYDMDTMALEIDVNSAEVKIDNESQRFSRPDSGESQSSLRCDLVTLQNSRATNSLSDLISGASDNEALRQQHPVQRCLIEVRSNKGRVYRSAGFTTYLSPDPSVKIDINFDMNHRSPSNNELLPIGRAVLANHSDHGRYVGFYDREFPYQILSFDSRSSPTSSHFGVTSRTGRMIAEGSQQLKIVEVSGENLIYLAPREKIEVGLNLEYSTKGICLPGGEFSLAGLRIPLKQEMLTEKSPYTDKSGKVVAPTIRDATQLHGLPADMEYFLRIFSIQLMFEGSHRRNFVAQPADC